jgi:cytochrome b561
MNSNEQRYTAVAIVLHWAIAAAILANLLIGWWMKSAIGETPTQARAIAAFQLHKSIGLTVLLLTALRLVWRFTHKPPPLPAGMARWERFATRGTHWAFYILMVLVPLSGWTYASR